MFISFFDDDDDFEESPTWFRVYLLHASLFFAPFPPVLLHRSLFFFSNSILIL